MPPNQPLHLPQRQKTVPGALLPYRRGRRNMSFGLLSEGAGMSHSFLKRTTAALATLCLIVVPVTLAAVGGHMWCDWVPDSVIERLPGATPTEVREQLGEPTEVSSGSEYERWHYRPPLRLAEFRVDFDASGGVACWSYDR